MPVVANDIDAATLAARIAQLKPDVAVVELVASRPGQGVASVFKFGVRLRHGARRHRRGGCSLHLVTPAKWKRHYGLDADKEKARALTLRYWPNRSDLFGLKKHHGRAEASLLARYFAETHGIWR